METQGLRKSEEEPWRVLEFYSGIGGMRYSLIKAEVNAIVVEAFDINNVANDVYEHNFDHRPYQGNIQSLSAADLASYEAHAWLLSPPCQPYTQQGLQKGSSDARASSFLNILELIPQTLKPPLMLFVENVVGFETSDTHKRMVEMLEKNDFALQEFILSPLQFGVPYSRPRYFCLAKRKPLLFQNPHLNGQLFCGPGPLYGQNDTIINGREEAQECWDELLQGCQTIEDFLEFKDSINSVDLESNSVLHNLSEVSEETDEGNDSDIVFPDSKRCCCFTKSYYRFVKGTGSLLATAQGRTKAKTFSLEELHLRYFTPREVANLHSFPGNFQFPQHVSLRQRYALLGNSLSVGVVAPLLSYLFTHPL